MFFTFPFDIDKDIIKVYYYENIKLLCQDLIDVALEYDWYIGQSKKHHLVLEIAIAAPKGRFPFIVFHDPHLIVGVSEIQLGKTLSLTQLIK